MAAKFFPACIPVVVSFEILPVRRWIAKAARFRTSRSCATSLPLSPSTDIGMLSPALLQPTGPTLAIGDESKANVFARLALLLELEILNHGQAWFQCINRGVVASLRVNECGMLHFEFDHR